jgi:hypothetical protein
MTKMEDAIGMMELSDDQIESVTGGTGQTPAEKAAMASAAPSASPTWQAGWAAYVNKLAGASQQGVPPSGQPRP